MQSFRFRLERILAWRRKEFEAEQARLGTIAAERQRLEAAQRAILAAWDRSARDLLASGSVDGGDLAALGGFRARLERELEANARLRREAAERLSGQRARTLEAQRRVRLLEKLRERRLGEWRVSWERELESLANDAFLARWPPAHGG